METPENYYAILGVPIDADSDTLKRAYRQLARRYHPDLAGPGGDEQMKRINRAYAVLSDPAQRLNYDTILGGALDFRKGGIVRPRPRPHRIDLAEDLEFSGLSIFSTKGPLHAGAVLHSTLGVISALGSIKTQRGIVVAVGTIDGKGQIWQVEAGKGSATISFVTRPGFTTESLRELRFSPDGKQLAGWGHVALHVWNASNGTLLWSYPLTERAVSAYYSLDMILQNSGDDRRATIAALPMLIDDARSPRAWGVRGTDIVTHQLDEPEGQLSQPIVCLEDNIANRQFWAVRLRGLAQDARTLLTLSCAHVAEEPEETVVIRHWNLTGKGRFGGKIRPQIITSILAGRCADCTPPYAFTPDVRMLAFVHQSKNIRIYDTDNGTYVELPTGSMGGSSRLAISADAQYLAVAREDSEVNEGVVDLWSVWSGQLVQKFYHPWQISALRFGEQQLLVALTDGTIQLWQY
ncbi:MAG TPA: DnaJ domain-containing protein [Ktedonobacteraceae bacterium]|nr:DnaJ domain-containing protein [Ktedonobacteraceae bacterium]